MHSFDEANLDRVARVVLRFNSHLKGYQPAELVEEMKNLARQRLGDDLGYVGTRGYILSAYRADDGSIGVKASIADYLCD